MWHRDMKRENAVVKMALIRLVQPSVATNLQLKKKSHILWSTTVQNIIKWGMPIYYTDVLQFMMVWLKGFQLYDGSKVIHIQ